jgi:type II secretory pathway pseudopilin PulG
VADVEAEHATGDEGFTLIETMMVGVVMSIVMAVFTSMILTMYRVSNAGTDKANAQAQIAVAVSRLDREVRYAKGISKPYTVGGNPYVDFLAVQQGKSTCVQMRVVAGTLAQRTWAYPVTGTFSPSVWSTLSTGVTSTTPFTYAGPDDYSPYQQLTVDLTAAGQSGSDQNVATFTALNTTRSSSNDYCAAGR